MDDDGVLSNSLRVGGSFTTCTAFVLDYVWVSGLHLSPHLWQQYPYLLVTHPIWLWWAHEQTRPGPYSILTAVVRVGIQFKAG